MQGASNALSVWKLPQGVQSPILKQILPTPKPVPVDPNKSPEVFKKRFIEKHGDWVAEDGRKYSAIPAPEIVAKVIRKYGDGVTTDGTPYRDYLPRPASPNDSLEYRLKQIEELSTAPKSQFYTTGWTRWQTEQEKKFTTAVTKRENEWELVKTLKAPYRAVYNAMETPSQWLQMAVSDALNLIWADETSKNLTRQLVKDKFEQDILNKDNKGLVWGIQEWSPSSIIGSLVTAIPNLLLYANPAGATAWIISTGGWLSLEWESQWQTGLWDKAIAYSAGTISGLIDKISGQKFIDGLLSKGIKKEVANWFVTKTKNFLKTLKPSDFEAGTEVVQQKIENWWRQLMGTEYDKGWKQYAEAGIMGKMLGKVSDVGQSQAPVTTLPPAPPKSVAKNLDVIQTIKTGIGGNKVLKQAKSRGFDPELDIATYEDLKPTITNDGRVNTDIAQENIQNFIDPYQEKLDQAIAEEWAIVPADTFRKNVLKEMESEKTNIVDYLKWVKMANSAIDTAIENFWDGKGNIPLEAVNDIKKKLQSVSNYLNPDDSAYKAIARGAKQIVEDFTSSADVKALNKDLARWYTTKEYLQILGSGTKTVKGGRLGKYAARLAGVVIGSQLWPIAGMVWWEVAAKLQSKMMQWALKGTKQAMPEIKSFGNIKKKQQLLLPPPSWKQTSASVVDVKPIAGYAPWILQKYEKARTNRQTSSSSTEDKTTQSQPAQVSGWTRKRVIVIPKKESAWKKVNNSIIQKLKEKKTEVKANWPKESKLPKKQETPKTSNIDHELESLQKQYETLPWVPKVEVPADYIPKDWLPTWTEFEAPIISSISKTKWKLPSPDVKRPQIRWFDLSTRSSMLESLKEQGMFTDSFFVVKDKNVSNKLFEYAEKKAIKKWNPTSGTKVDMKALVERAENGADTLLTPKEYMKLWKENGVYLRMDIWNWNQVAVNASYADIFFKNFDDVTFKWNNELSPVVVLSKWEPVWVIMPIKDVYSLKGKLGDFSMQSKTPQVEGKTATEVLKDWKPTKWGYSMDNIDIKNTNAFPRSQYHRPEYINSDSYKYWLEQAKQWKEIPPIVVEKKGDWYHILDGYHRIAAAEDAGVKNIKALVLDTPINKTGKPFTKFTDEELKNISKPKPSALSQKSEVKYSKPIEDSNAYFAKEAKKYKSAEEFVKAQQKPKSDSVRLYRGMTSKFDKNFDLSKTDAPNGYSTWTDNPELARQYAGDKGHIYQIDLPKKQEGMELLNNDGDRVLFLDNQKKAGLNNVSGKEYLIYNDHDLYNPDLIKEAPTKQQLLDIYNKANKK